MPEGGVRAKRDLEQARLAERGRARRRPAPPRRLAVLGYARPPVLSLERPMPAPSLSRVLVDVRERISKAGARGLNEQNTKATLIEPVLRALGWDTEDVDEVRREYRLKTQDKPVDYGLLVHREPRLLVEAKGLGEPLSDRRWANQIMGYAAVCGVQWIVLTDGDEYQIYNAAASVPVDQKLFRTVRVSQNATEVEETLALLSKKQLAQNRIDTLWKAVHVDRKVRKALESMFSGDCELALVNFVHARTRDLSVEDVRASLRRCRVQPDFPLRMDELEAEAKPAKPTKQRSEAATEASSVSLGSLIEAGLIRVPAEIEATFKKTRLTARIEGPEAITFLGKAYPSLSAAGSAARAHVLRSTKLPATNGWDFWRIREPGGDLTPIGDLRTRFLGSRQSGKPRKKSTGSAG